FQPSLNHTPSGYDQPDGFVAKFAPDGTLAWLTYLGGNLQDQVNGISVDTNGDVLVVGTTFSHDFPVTSDGYQTTCPADPTITRCRAGFLSRISADGRRLVWSTLLSGASGIDLDGEAVALSQGLACITGDITSDSLPVTTDAPQRLYGGGGDAFVSCF